MEGHLKHTMSQNDGNTDKDEDGEHQSLEYAEPILPPQYGPSLKGGPSADDESRMFMSEPSLSEGGDSSGHVQARQRYGPSPPPIPQAPAALPPYVPNSPGNTSLSSWESPAIKNKVLLHFTPEKQTRVNLTKGPNGVAVSMIPNTSRHGSEADSSYENSRSRQVSQPPPLPSMSFTSESHQQQRTTGTDEVSHPPRVPPFDGHRLHSLGNFIDKLRHRSEGALQNSPPSAAASRAEQGADFSQINAVMRTGVTTSGNGAATGHAQSATAAVAGAAAAVVNTDTIRLPPPTSIFDSERTVDVSLAMTLSDSENEGDIDQHMALYGTAHADDDDGNDDEDADADWEAENSAGDDIAVKRLARIKTQSTGRASNTGHIRTRSGDGAAAALATGGKHYRISIPVEDCYDDEDEDEDDDGDNNRGVRAMQGRRRDRVLQSRDGTNRPVEGSSYMHALPGASMQNPPYGSLRPLQEALGRELSALTTTSDEVDVDVSSRDAPIFSQGLFSSRDPPIYSQGSGEIPPFNPAFSSPREYTDEADEAESDFNDGERPMNVQENRLQFSAGEQDIGAFEQHFEDRQFRGSNQTVFRSHAASRDSPFQNIGKNSTEKANRSTFMPKSSVIEDDPKSCATYVCPNCRTIQREFFTVADAPRQLESASGYLALYFAIYVVASLFIFGLEEGWEPLDCIYFAVVTLTTAGLGDFVPTTDANKIICSIFIYFGVACIGLLLGQYIAGMLDDKAYREAKAKQINSCPNCARLQTIREAAKVGSRASFSRAITNQPTKMNRHMSERIFDKPQQQDHAAKYVSGHHHKRGHHSGSSSRRSPDGHSKQSNQSGQFELTPSVNDSKHHRDGSSSVESHGLPSPYSSQQPSPNFLGSPMTRQILGRQSHTRHGSMDIRGNEFFAGGVTSAGPKTYGATRSRGFSADMPSAQPPPINENGPFEVNNSIPPTLPFVQTGVNGSDDDIGYCSDDEESSVCSTSSSSSSEVLLLDETATKLRAAKYVFLTLRQALVNSMVIIAVGCVGFWLIEGFSLVDSWYFTTVFLTTVGYGDICPVTRGGKLFATVYILVGGTILLNNMSLISMIPLELRKRRIERAVLTQFGDHLDDAALRELATGPLIQRLHLSASRTDGLDECTREMFSLAMLVRLGKVSEQDIRETFASFRRLDVNDEGVLNSKSIIAAMIQKRRALHSERALQSERALHPEGPPLQYPDRPPPPPAYIPQHPREQSAEQEEPANVWIDDGAPHNSYYYQDPEAGTNERSSLLQQHQTTPDSFRRASPAGSRLGRKNSQESPF